MNLLLFYGKRNIINKNNNNFLPYKTKLQIIQVKYQGETLHN